MQAISAKLFAPMALLALFGAAHSSQAACDRPGIEILGADLAEGDACEAIGDVFSYFAAAGLRTPSKLMIRFQARVAFMQETFVGAEPVAVSGYFDARRNEVRMTSARSDWNNHRRPWGLAWDSRLGRSILQHEIAHAVIYHLLGESSSKLPRAWHEALAYAIQIELMEPDLRAAVLARYPDRQVFTSTLHINDFVYGADPDGFAVAAYRTYVDGGRQIFLLRALRFEFPMIDMRDLP